MFRATFAAQEDPLPNRILKCNVWNLLNKFSMHILSFRSNCNEKKTGWQSVLIDNHDLMSGYYVFGMLLC